MYNSHSTRERDEAARLHEAIDRRDQATAFARLFGGEKGSKRGQRLLWDTPTPLSSSDGIHGPGEAVRFLTDEDVALDALERNRERCRPSASRVAR